MNALERAQAEQERRARAMAEAQRFSPYGRPEREAPPAEAEGAEAVEIVRSRRTRDGGELAPPSP